MDIRNKQGQIQQVAVSMTKSEAAAIHAWLSTHKLTGCPTLKKMYTTLEASN